MNVDFHLKVGSKKYFSWIYENIIPTDQGSHNLILKSLIIYAQNFFFCKQRGHSRACYSIASITVQVFKPTYIKSSITNNTT